MLIFLLFEQFFYLAFTKNCRKNNKKVNLQISIFINGHKMSRITEKSLKIILTKVHDYVAVSSVLDHHTV